MESRIYQTPSDYNHIRAYGLIMGWTMDLIKGQQKLAYMINAPYDTVELAGEVPKRFRELPRDVKQLFGSV